MSEVGGSLGTFRLLSDIIEGRLVSLPPSLMNNAFIHLCDSHIDPLMDDVTMTVCNQSAYILSGRESLANTQEDVGLC